MLIKYIIIFNIFNELKSLIFYIKLKTFSYDIDIHIQKVSIITIKKSNA